MKLSIGIDISKAKFDVSFFNGDNHSTKTYQNSESGIAELHKDISRLSFSDLIITMEATGTYHLKAAKKLYHLGYTVSVVNPLIIKRFAEMKMLRAKTDAMDSRIIAEYGFFQEPKLFKPKNKQFELILQLSKSIEDLNTAKNENGNRMEALKQDPDVSDEVLQIYISLHDVYKNKIRLIENRIKELVQDNKVCKNLQSIPGIGKRIGPVLIGTFGKFEDFETAKQVASFIGVNPSPFQSGSSIAGKGSISRKGNSYLRKLLYMASLSAIKYNKSCRELYNRMLYKGKDKPVALIAVANKLIRQIYAIAKYERVYDENYQYI